MSEEISGVMATLAAPTVDRAIDGTLDPQPPEAETTVQVPAYVDMAILDQVRLFITSGGTATQFNSITVSNRQIGKPIVFFERLERFAEYLGREIQVSYEIWRDANRLHTSRGLPLEIKAGFEGDYTLDLRTYNYVVVTGKPPLNSPSFSRFTRAAAWGVAPYEYASSDTAVASAGRQGDVTATGNGICTISATDSQGQTKRYNLTVTGIGQLHFLTATANWSGMRDACVTAGLDTATLAQLRQLMNIYSESAGSLTDYFGRLPYPFWTGELNGANTAWIVDLDKPENDPLDPNPTSVDLNESHQVLGISMR